LPRNTAFEVRARVIPWERQGRKGRQEHLCALCAFGDLA